ncbi:MAG: ComF family protein [Akkermansiaceae bacterium]|jgi:ComF family protein|nr:ComF family protein [Akkermansiaceae bacterium]MCU0776846.1 ComF family protein [Akkermansiaceae bacterium]
MPPDPEIPAWKRAFLRMLDGFYPPRCALCGTSTRDGRSLCGECDAGLPRLVEPFCKSCGEAFAGVIDRAFSCPNCHDLRYAFDFARPATIRDKRTLELVHRLKYNRELHLAEELGRLAAGAFADSRLGPALDMGWPLVPVPLHRKRQRERHFNQAAEIARALSRLTGLPVLHALRRTRDTETQTMLSRRQRMENLRGAFDVTHRGHRWIHASPQGAVLVDDVLTTGSTVNECAKTLRRAGFQRVSVVSVMRG